MKIYSWNILYRNKELDRAFEFISKSNFDIFCLQEVPREFLERLQTLPCSLASRIDVERLFTSGTVYNHVVILSKHPVVGQGEIPFEDYWPFLPLRTRLFVRLMRPLYWSKITNRGGLFVDVKAEEQVIRVFNLHLILGQPALRLKEFEQTMAKRDPSRPTIVCGDFNTLEARHITMLSWFLGASLGDALLHRRERMNIQKHFVEHQLINPLAGGITHPLSQSQLDHILVSHSFTIKNASVLPDRIGSDHHPICVEVV